MPVYFLDTSALVKRYVAEPGSQSVIAMTSAPDAVVVIADITRAELTSALARRARAGDLTAEQHDTLKAAFAAHLLSEYLLAPLEAAHITAACRLIERHVLRAYDAIQLAVALAVGDLLAPTGASPTFLSTDGRLTSAAKAEGLEVSQPVAD